MKPILILSTTDTPELAQSIAKALVESRLAACVNVIHGIQSFYRWQDKLCDDQECLLLIKSTEERFDAVRLKIRQLHSYEVPEVIAIPVTNGDLAYLEWLREQTQS